jgi:hypothetical protein
MNERGPHFWIGNLLLALSMVMLLFLQQLWAAMGSWAMVLWMLLAGVGMYLVTRDKGPPGANMPN